MVKLKILAIIIIVVGSVACLANQKPQPRPAALATFDHDAHRENGCFACHHNEDGDPATKDAIENGDIETDCASCHDDMQQIFHAQCIECHNKKSAPSLCGNCHKEAK